MSDVRASQIAQQHMVEIQQAFAPVLAAYCGYFFFGMVGLALTEVKGDQVTRHVW